MRRVGDQVTHKLKKTMVAKGQRFLTCPPTNVWGRVIPVVMATMYYRLTMLMPNNLLNTKELLFNIWLSLHNNPASEVSSSPFNSVEGSGQLSPTLKVTIVIDSGAGNSALSLWWRHLSYSVLMESLTLDLGYYKNHGQEWVTLQACVCAEGDSKGVPWFCLGPCGWMREPRLGWLCVHEPQKSTASLAEHLLLLGLPWGWRSLGDCTVSPGYHSLGMVLLISSVKLPPNCSPWRSLSFPTLTTPVCNPYLTLFPLALRILAGSACAVFTPKITLPQCILLLLLFLHRSNILTLETKDAILFLTLFLVIVFPKYYYKI